MGVFEEAVERLERDGYCRLPGIYSKTRVHDALDRVRASYERCKNKASSNVPFLNIGQPTVYNLQNKDNFFLEFLFEPKLIEDLLIHFLNDPWYKPIPQDRPNYVLRSYIARSSNLTLPMHIDSFIPYLGPYVFVIQYSIILEDQDSENGCTMVVPGSHLAGEYATQDAFADAVPIESEAGDVVIWDSRLWHGTRENKSGHTRWAIVATFCRWWLKQHWNVTQTLPQETYAKLSDSQRAVLGFCSMPPRDEEAGIDIKRGYNSLLPDVQSYRKVTGV